MAQMTPETKARLATALAKNSLLPVLLEEQCHEIHEQWENEQDARKREGVWHQLRATIDLKDYLYGRIEQLTSGGGPASNR